MQFLEPIRKKIDFKYLEYLYLLGLLFYTIKIITRLSMILDLPDSIGDLLYTLSFYLMIPKIVLNRYEKKDCIICLSTLALGFYIYHFKQTSLLSVIPLALAGLKGSDIRKIIKMIFALWIIMGFYTICVIHPYQYDSSIYFGIIFGETAYIQDKLRLRLRETETKKIRSKYLRYESNWC